MSIIDHSLLISETQSLQQILSDNNFLQHSKKEIEKIYESLITCIVDHNHLYYIDTTPLITDTEYDRLFDALKKIENNYPELISNDSPTQKLIGQSSHSSTEEKFGIQTKFEKSDHQSPILSLQNTYNIEEIIERYESISRMLEKVEGNSHPATGGQGGQLKLLIEPKYDGLAIVITYRDGKLVKAVTRGDGYIGDDVTENIKTIKNLPKVIDYKGAYIVRGEVLMPKSVRKKINTEREENNEEPFANTRNAAAGSLKLLDTNEVAKRGLFCYIYDILQGNPEILNQFEKYTSPSERGDREVNINEIIKIISSSGTKENLLKADIDFDGLVIKVIDPEIRKILGSTNHHPRRAIAYKFPAQQIATQIKSIERQIGRTGILTPVANLTPTELSGVTISRVSLHNRDFIQSKNLMLGDRVWLQRSGEVIPYIVGVITNRRDKSEKEISDQIICPACGTHAQRINNEVGTKSKPEISTQFFCPNSNCTGILKEQLKHFVSKNCMNIASIGDAMIEIVVDQGLVYNLADLYTLTQSEKIFLLKRFPGIADKKIDLLVDELNKSKINEFRRFLNALGIPGVGIKIAKEIEKALGASSGVKQSEIEGSHIMSIIKIISSPDFLTSIYGIGETIIKEIAIRCNDPKHIQLIKKLEQYGIHPTIQNLSTVRQNSGTVCITGTFPLSRSELEFYITHAGYTFSPTLTKGVNYLFVGDHAGSKKDKIGPNTTIISNREEICTMLDISTPLFENTQPAKGDGKPESKGKMQSLFG